jgi:hypothetical protein
MLSKEYEGRRLLSMKLPAEDTEIRKKDTFLKFSTLEGIDRQLVYFL